MTGSRPFPVRVEASQAICLPLALLVVLSFPQAGQAQNSISPDRLAAEWVIRVGGSVILEGQDQVISELDKLPPADLHVRSINLVGTLIEPPKLALLSPLTHLKELFLPASMWNPQSNSKLDANDEFRHL